MSITDPATLPQDASDADPNDSAMIALLPITSDWCQIDLPHLTLVYAGLIQDLSPTDFNDMAKDAASLAMLTGSIYVKVQGVEAFGDTEKVNALKIQPSPELWAMRKFVDHWNASKFPFNPHCTIGPVAPLPEFVPKALAFDRIFVGFGEDQMTFWLRGNGGMSSY